MARSPPGRTGWADPVRPYAGRNRRPGRSRRCTLRGFGALQRSAVELEDENAVVRRRDRRDGRAELGQRRRHLVRDSSGILLRPELQCVASRSLADAAWFQGREGGIREHHCVSPEERRSPRDPGSLSGAGYRRATAPIAARSLRPIGPSCESQHQWSCDEPNEVISSRGAARGTNSRPVEGVEDHRDDEPGRGARSRAPWTPGGPAS